MNYKIGDTVMHWTHGIGIITAIEEKTINGETQQFYAVSVKNFKYWAPVIEADNGSLHYPIESIQFIPLFGILQTHGGILPDQQYQRKNELRERLQKQTLGDLCHLIRDLSDRSHIHNLNQDDSSILLHAKEHLLDEWVFSFGAERSSALDELEVLLRGDPIQPAIVEEKEMVSSL